jgi:hypothetical protein
MSDKKCPVQEQKSPTGERRSEKMRARTHAHASGSERAIASVSDKE